MPDTKSGREKKGRNKRAQLEHRLARRDLRMDEMSDEPPRLERIESEYLVPPTDRDRD